MLILHRAVFIHGAIYQKRRLNYKMSSLQQYGIVERQFAEADLLSLPNPNRFSSGRGNSKYRVRLEIGRDRQTDEPVYKSIYGKSTADVRQKTFSFIQNEIAAQTERNRVGGKLNYTIEQWLRTEKFGRVRQSTYDRLECTYLNQIRPYIEGMELREVTKNDCRQILQSNLEKGYSASTIKKASQFLKEFFRFQTAEDPTLRNPMANLKFFTEEFIREQQTAVREARDRAKEKKEKGQRLSPEEKALVDSRLQMKDQEEIHVLTPEEVLRIRDVMENGYVLRWESKKGNPIETAPQKLKQAEFFLFLLNTGLRAGEARALKYSDVDFETRRMVISRNRTTTRKRDAKGNVVGGMAYVEGKPKTKSSARVLYLSLAALEMLKHLKAQEPEGYDGYIANADGKPLNDANFRRRFDSLLSHAEVQHCGLHALRHTFASYYYEYTNGNRKLVADYLGHSISNLTERVYVTTSDRFMEQSIRDFVI